MTTGLESQCHLSSKCSRLEEKAAGSSLAISIRQPRLLSAATSCKCLYRREGLCAYRVRQVLIIPHRKDNMQANSKDMIRKNTKGHAKLRNVCLHILSPYRIGSKQVAD